MAELLASSSARVALLVSILLMAACLRVGLERDRSAIDGDLPDDGGTVDGGADSDHDSTPSPDADAADDESAVECPPGQALYQGACWNLCDVNGQCPGGERCVTIVCLPEGEGCETDGDCSTGHCACADPSCTTTRCNPVDCGCRYDEDGDGECDGLLASGVDNVRDTCGPDLACDGLGSCQRALGQACSLGEECGTGHCSDDVCCAEPCDGNCDLCGLDGLCVGEQSACTGECPACMYDGGAWRCQGDDSICDELCRYTTCEGSGTEFNCDFTYCGYCATRDSPIFEGHCGSGIDVLLPTSCRYSYGYTETDGYYIFWGFSELECQDGVWVSVDGDDDAGVCGSCDPEWNEDWSDTCGNTSGHNLTCVD